MVIQLAIRIPVVCLALLAISASARGDCTRLPVPVPDRIGRLQVFASRIPDKTILLGRRDIIWGDDHAKVPGVYSMFYMMSDRDGERQHDLGWYEKSHPDELVYQCDQQTVANEFRYSFGYFAPVDIHNDDVRERLFSQTISGLLSTSRAYDALAIDNVSPRNEWKRCGVRRADGWHNLYSGAPSDLSFARDVADWIGWLRRVTHKNNMCLAVNLYFHGGDEEGYRLIAAQSDILVDEHGFTRKCMPMDYDQNWIERATLYAEIARTKPFGIIDYACPLLSQIDRRVLNWSIANYLVVKGNRTFLAIIPEKEAGGTFVDFHELYISTGPPLASLERRGDVFFRRFQHALSLVNPFTHAATYDLGSVNWEDLGGQKVAGRIVLPPGTGLVLLSDTH